MLHFFTYPNTLLSQCAQDTNFIHELTTVQFFLFCVDGAIFQFVTGDSRVCNQEADLPTTNLYAETYGPGSRCVEHGRQWFLTTNEASSTSEVYGGGCYQVWLCIYTYLTLQLNRKLLLERCR